MPQTFGQWLGGYVHLTIDTLSQRLVSSTDEPSHGVFSDGSYLRGKRAIVTGANTGIGLETTRMLCRAGADITLACRSGEKAQAAMDDISRADPTLRPRLRAARLDLADLDSVRAFAADINTRDDGRVDMLVLNGGIMGVAQTIPESHMMVNHVAHALLTLLLIPALRRSSEARVVWVSSLTVAVSDLRMDDMHFDTRRYQWMTAYANSKLLMLLFMKALATRLRDADMTHVRVNAVHPGECASDVARHLGRVWSLLHKRFGPLFLLSVPQSARTSVYVAGAREICDSGGFYHRVSEQLTIGDHLVPDDDVDRAWDITLIAAGVTHEDLLYLT